MKKENDVLEQTLALAADDYAAAYAFLLTAYETEPAQYGPQTLYFLACLAGGSGRPDKALGWLQTAIGDNGWWYRPEVLEDDDLATLVDDAAFISLKAASDARYNKARADATAEFTWAGKRADNLFVAVHGNTQNGQTAREDWRPLLPGDPAWQLETVQSAEPDGYGTYRWSYDLKSYLPVADALGRVQQAGYRRLVGGGFSAGCDMLLRAVTFSPVRCDTLVLQSPWIPILQQNTDDVIRAIREKGIELIIRCGAEDEDCLPMAKELYDAGIAAGLPTTLTIQPGCRHQFPDGEPA